MRTSLALLALLALVPSTALADDDVPAPPAQPAQPATPPPVRVSAASTSTGYVAPEIVPYEGGDIAADAKLITKPNFYVAGTGIALLSAAYFGSLMYGLATCTAQSDCRPGSGFLYIPVIGPFITAAYAINDPIPTSGGRALAAFAGGVQVLGVALTAAGFIWPRKFVMWQNKSTALSVTPTAGTASAPGEKSGFSAGFAVTVTNL